jgi:acyl dehydratase
MPEEKLFFDDVNEGDAAPEFSHELTRTDLVMYAGASGDFNPLHHDEVKAQDAGLPSVFGHGMFTMGLLGKALTDYVGVGNLEKYQVRFTKQTWPGETLTTKVSVAKKYEEDGKQKVVLDCEVVNQDGESKVQGTAVAALPSR